MPKNLLVRPQLSLKFIALLLLLAGLGLTVGLSMERQLYQKGAQETVVEAGCQTEALAIPQNLRGWSGPKTGQISLVWDQVEKVDDYKINYGEDLDFWRYEVNNLNKTQTYTASGLTPGKDYYFIVSALNECGDSEPSKILKATAYDQKVDQNIIYADQLDLTVTQEATPEAELTEDESATQSAEATTESVETEESTPAAETEAEDETEETMPRLLEEEEPEFKIGDLFKGIGPWVFGAVLLWGIIVLVRTRLKNLSKETTDLSQGTEIPLEEIAEIPEEPEVEFPVKPGSQPNDEPFTPNKGEPAEPEPFENQPELPESQLTGQSPVPPESTGESGLDKPFGPRPSVNPPTEPLVKPPEY